MGNSKFSRAQKITGSVLALILILFMATFFWLRQGPLSPIKEGFFKVIPFPLALVNGQPIYIDDFLFRYNVLKKFYPQNTNGDPQKVKRDLFDAMVEDSKTSQLAQKNGISVSKKQLDSEYLFRSASSGSSVNDFKIFLSGYGLSEDSFKSIVLKPDLETTALTIWFNKQENLNTQSFYSLKEIKDKLNSGQSLEDLASAYSQDASSNQLNGDLGFLNSNELLPELLEQLDTMKVGEIKTIVTRFGIHIIKLEGKDNNGPNNGQRLHLGQIFIQPSSFKEWFNQETKNYKVKKLIEI